MDIGTVSLNVNVKVKNIDRFIELNNDIRNNNIERENQNG